MSENQSENQSPQSSFAISSDVGRTSSPSNADELVIEDVPRQMTMGSIVSESGLAEPAAEGSDDVWDAVDLPGTVTGAKLTSPTDNLSVMREKELLTLIHDLNECNDVLLTKISKLEAALKESQRSVQSEVERAQTAQEKMVEQVLAQQAAAQQTAQTAQQQVAKLVGQLDTAEQTLRRQELVQETIQAELDEAQDRITQLEHECALTTQQHADEAQARIKAETTNRDLRSRLQRQQRYTLQFKAALEKSLTVNARPAAVAASVVSEPISFNEQDSIHSSVTMPRAERIVPWAAIGDAPFAGIDPHLENLIRNQADVNAHSETTYTESRSEFRLERSQPSAPELSAPELSTPELSTPEPSAPEPNISDSNTPNPSIPTPSTKVPVVDSEAETKLWQDLERIMGAAATATAADSQAVDLSAPETATETETVEATESADTINAEPRLNWQAKSTLPIDPTTTSNPTTSAGASPATTQSLPAVDPSTANSAAAAAKIIAAQIEQARTEQTQTRQQNENYLPLTDSEASAVSPVVNPLRTQRKIGSMAAVQLPTFEKAKAGSFKR